MTNYATDQGHFVDGVFMIRYTAVDFCVISKHVVKLIFC